MAEAEGMICPVCLSQFGSVGSLERHWAEAHSTTPTQTSAFKNFFKTLTRTAEEAFDATEDAILEDRDREKPQKQTLIDLKSMVTRHHWDEASGVCHTCRRPLQAFKSTDHCRCCGNVFCTDHLGFTVRVSENAALHPQGVEVESCKVCFEHFEEMMTGSGGIYRSLTQIFIKNREHKIGQLELETNKLLGRMRKLGTALNEAIRQGTWAVGGSRRVAMSIEQKIVEWDNDNTSFCSLCKDRFGYFDRHHHCRLCGRVVCTKEKQCSTLLTLNHLRKLQKKIGMRQLKEKLHPTLRNYPVRACRRCHHLLRRREQECDDKKAQADPLTEQYQLWRAKRDEIEDLVEEGESIRDKVYVSPEDVERSVELRRSIKLLLAACDALGKQIAVAPPVAPTQSNAQQRTPKQATQQANSVQAMAIRTNIRRAIIQYMQRRLMDVQLFPIKPSPKPPPAPILAPATRTRSATVDITQNRSNQCKLTGTMSQSNIRAAVNNGTGSR